MVYEVYIDGQIFGVYETVAEAFGVGLAMHKERSPKEIKVRSRKLEA